MNSQKILIVNDDAGQLKLLEFILRQADFEVCSASSGNSAFEIASREKPDLIISDVIMPDGDGLELCQLIRADKKLCVIPVILISGLRKDTESVIRGLNAGADDYLQIPYEPLHLIAVAARCIERKRTEDALKQKDKLFRNLIENMTDVMSIVAPDCTLIFNSSSVENIFGYTPQELQGKIVTDFIHPDDQKKAADFFHIALENDAASPPVEYRFRHKNNSWMTVESVGKCYDDPIHGLVVIVNSRDISAQNKAFSDWRESEDKLRESEERYRLLFESNPLPMWVYQPETLKFLTVNDAAIKHYEYSRAEFLAMTIKDIRPPEDVPHLLENLSDSKKGAELDKFWRHYKKNGELIDVEITQDEVEFSGERAELVLAIDITERKKSEAAILFQADLLNTVEQAVIATDLDGKVIYWNQFAHKLYGYTSAEAVGRSIMELTTPDIALDEAENLMPRLSAGKSWSGEFTVKNKEGKIFPAQIFNSPIHDGSGKLIGIVGISYDNSERRDTMAAIVEANDRAIFEYDRLLQRISRLAQTFGKARDLAAVFNAILDFAWLSVPCSGLVVSLYDAEHSRRTVIYMWYNGKEVDVSGFAPMPVGSGLVGRTIKTGEVIIEDDYPATLKTCKNMMSYGFDEDERIPLSALFVPMKMMGKVIGTIEVQSYESAAYRQEHATAMRMAANLAANSIENVRLLERDKFNAEQLKQAQKLESVGRLAGGIAHDFNNMLTAINGYSDLTLRRLAADDPLRRNVEEIKKAGQRSAELTYQLLAFSRQQVLKAEIIEINEVVNETSQMLERLIGEDVQLEIKLDPQIGAVKADPGQLSQVIMNLAVNARDSMPNGGNLLIETSNIILDEEYERNHFPVRAGSYVRLLVADTGTGIEDEILQHIFEPFFTTKDVGKGTGLGLATVYGIVKQSDGYIWVRSDVGSGTTFKIYLPRIEEIPVVEVKTDSESVPKGTETILLVEDEEMVRNMSREILEECGYKVIEAENGLEALSIFQNSGERINLLMTDVVMPKMGGRELSEILAQTHPQIGVLFTSGYTDDTAIRSNVIESGANFIAKPYTYNDLAKKIRSVLDAGQNVEN